MRVQGRAVAALLKAWKKIKLGKGPEEMPKLLVAVQQKAIDRKEAVT